LNRQLSHIQRKCAGIVDECHKTVFVPGLRVSAVAWRWLIVHFSIVAVQLFLHFCRSVDQNMTYSRLKFVTQLFLLYLVDW